MTYNHTRIGLALASVLGSLSALACGGAAVPHDQMTAAEANVSAAEAGGAEDVPRAALSVKKAKDQITEAKALIEKGENEKAEWALERASVDATLALAIARETALQVEAEKALAEVQALKDKSKK
ncbi:MAG TPA: DUF4398 domain-containing protein [Polyangiaceae bacterium]|nr:DUF4398 domain-containing protein [Polyangiaceae bacterium]